MFYNGNFMKIEIKRVNHPKKQLLCTFCNMSTHFESYPNVLLI